jgi:hypothetical protein
MGQPETFFNMLTKCLYSDTSDELETHNTMNMRVGNHLQINSMSLCCHRFCCSRQYSVALFWYTAVSSSPRLSTWPSHYYCRTAARKTQNRRSCLVPYVWWQRRLEGGEDKTRQDKTRQDKARQDKESQVRQGKIRQAKTRQATTRQAKTGQDKTRID